MVASVIINTQKQQEINPAVYLFQNQRILPVHTPYSPVHIVFAAEAAHGKLGVQNPFIHAKLSRKRIERKVFEHSCFYVGCQAKLVIFVKINMGFCFIDNSIYLFYNVIC